jgi:hypothetical protein
MADSPDNPPAARSLREYVRVRNGQVMGKPRVMFDPRKLQIGAEPAHPERAYFLPVEVINPSFDPATQIKEGPTYTVLADKAVMTFTVRAKTADEASSMKAEKIERVHQLGDAKLSALVTLRQQVQALTRLVQLLYAHTDTSTWTAQQRQLVAALGGRLANIQNIREMEDTKVTELTALPNDAAAINAYDENAGW